MTRPGLIIVALAACGGGRSSSDAPKFEITAEHLAAVNAAIPAELKGKIEFEIGVLEEKKGKHPRRFKLVRPKGWKPGFMFGELKPADADEFRSPTLGKTRMDLGSNCDGMCEPKEWAKIADKVHFARFASTNQPGKIVKDVKTATSRTVVFEHQVSEHFPDHDVAVTIVTAWWVPDGHQYFVCEAALGTPAKGLADAFEKVCAKVSGD
jgi:hypothetical protein